MASKGNIRKRKRVNAIGRQFFAAIQAANSKGHQLYEYRNSKRGKRDSKLLEGR